MSLILLSFLACNHATVPEAAPVPEIVPVEAATEAATPAALYEGCRDRVEGPEADGECTTDEECARGGCSSEVCTSAARAPEVVTSCEVLPCFGTLQACGCLEGRCRWTLAEALPGLPLPRIPIKVPPRGD